MSKRCKLMEAHVATPTASTSVESHHVVSNWKLCVICHDDTSSESLICPATSKHPGAGRGYSSLAKNIEQFAEIGALPETINVARLDEGSGIEATIKEHQAVWHKSCAMKYNNTQLTRMQKRKYSEGDMFHSSSPVKTRSNFTKHDASKGDVCFFCDEASSAKDLRKVMTDVDNRIRRCATELNDTLLLAKLADGDMFARDALYHPKCLAALYNRTRAHGSGSCDQQPDNAVESIALAELVAYIEDCRSTGLTSPVFKLADLGKMFSARLQQLDPSPRGRVNTTRLKNRLLNHIPDLRTHTQGRDILMMFDQDIGRYMKPKT